MTLKRKRRKIKKKMKSMIDVYVICKNRSNFTNLTKRKWCYCGLSYINNKSNYYNKLVKFQTSSYNCQSPWR